MEKSGFIDKIFNQITNIYDEEHSFTINELRKISQKCKMNNEVFDFIDHYSSNSQIFKKNFIAILEMFIDVIWNSKFEKVYKAYKECEYPSAAELLDLKSKEVVN